MTWRVGALELAPDSTIPPTTNLLFWVKADQISGVADGTGLSLWQDQSGNSYDVTQATSGNRPIYRATGFGGLPGVQFTRSSSQYLARSTNIQNDGNLWTIYAAIRPTLTTHEQLVVYNGDDLAGWGLSNSTTGGKKGGLLGFVAWLESSQVADTTAEVYTLIQDRSGAGSCTLRINGTAYSIGTHPANTPSNSYFGVGAEVGGTVQRFFDGYIAEILIYYAAHDSTTAGIVETYLRSRWSI